jgi:hypothetical protein
LTLVQFSCAATPQTMSTGSMNSLVKKRITSSSELARRPASHHELRLVT